MEQHKVKYNDLEFKMTVPMNRIEYPGGERSRGNNK